MGNLTQLLVLATIGLAALLTSIVVVQTWAPSARCREGQWYLEALILILGPATCLVVSFYPDGIPAQPFSQINSALRYVAIGLAILAFVAALLQPRKKIGGLVAAVFVYYIALILAGVAGVVPAMPDAYLITPLVVLAFVMHGGYSYEWLLRTLTFNLRAIILLSLLAAFVLPDIAFNTVESRTVFGFSRLQGIALHPNGLAFLAVLLILIQTARNPKKIWQLLAVVALVLAQSSTAYIALLIGLALMKGRFAIFLRWVTTAAAVVAMSIYIVSPRTLGDIWESVAPEDFNSLNGRTRIWTAALYGFRQNPPWGYGPSLLNEEFRSQYMSGAFEAAGQAHNQFVQSLGESGLVGASTLGILTLVLIVRAWHARIPSAGLPLAVLGAFLVRSLTETPLRPSGVSLATFVVVAVICLIATAPRAEVPREKKVKSPLRGTIYENNTRVLIKR